MHVQDVGIIENLALPVIVKVSKMSAYTDTLTISDIENFHHGIDSALPAVVRLPKGNKISVAAAIELSCLLIQSRSEKLDTAVDRQLSQCPVWKLFRRMRRESLSKATTEQTVLVRIPPVYDEDWFHSEASTFENRLLAGRLPKGLARSLTGAVFEMVDNIWVHSRSVDSCFLAYQVGFRKFTFGISDIGVGVLQTLRQNPRYAHIRTSMDALEHAVKRGVSGQPQGSGLGLDSLTRSLASLWGQSRLRSGQAALTFNREGESPRRRHQFLANLAGFQISAICRMEPPQ